MPRAQAFKKAAFEVFRGLGRDYRRAFDEPGPAIPVQQFRTGEATPAAGIARILTSMASYSRARANFREQQRQQRLKEGFLQAQTAQMMARASGQMSPYEEARIGLAERSAEDLRTYRAALLRFGADRTAAYVSRSNRTPDRNTVPQQVGAAARSLGIMNMHIQQAEEDAATRGREDALRWLRLHDTYAGRNDPHSKRMKTAAANALGVREDQPIGPQDRQALIKNHVDRWVGLFKTGTTYKRLLAQRAPYEQVIQSTGLTGEPGEMPPAEDQTDWEELIRRAIPDPSEVAP